MIAPALHAAAGSDAGQPAPLPCAPSDAPARHLVFEHQVQVAMSFRPDSLGAAGRPAGVVDYRLARNSVVKEFRRGRLKRVDICDAQPELLRNAAYCGRPAVEPCPICEGEMVLVTYVFGTRLPASGRCIIKMEELAKLDRAAEERAAYVVEVCGECSWNHLVRSFPVGRRRRTT